MYIHLILIYIFLGYNYPELQNHFYTLKRCDKNFSVSFIRSQE